MHGFKNDILAIFQFWQNGTFEPMHEIQIFFFGQKTSFELSIMLMTFTEKISTMSKGPPNP